MAVQEANSCGRRDQGQVSHIRGWQSTEHGTWGDSADGGQLREVSGAPGGRKGPAVGLAAGAEAPPPRPAGVSTALQARVTPCSLEPGRGPVNPAFPAVTEGLLGPDRVVSKAALSFC